MRKCFCWNGLEITNLREGYADKVSKEELGEKENECDDMPWYDGH